MPSVVIVGAGPAGTRAAETLAAAGLRPIVIDEAHRSGGQIYRRQPHEISRDGRALYGFEAARAKTLHDTFDALGDSIDYRPATAVWSASEHRLDLIGPGGPDSVGWDRLIIATGAMDRVIPVPGWDLPGVFTLGGAQVSLKSQACAIGSNPVFLGTGPLLYLVAYQYLKAGVKPAAVLDTSTFGNQLRALPFLLQGGTTFLKGLCYLGALRAASVVMHTGVWAPELLAPDGQVSRVKFRTGAAQRELACDAVGLGFGLRSETQLADLCELTFGFDAVQRQWLPKLDAWGRGSVQGIYLAGDGAAVSGAAAAELAGTRAALALLHDLGDKNAGAVIGPINRRLGRLQRFRDAMETRAFALPTTLAADCADDLMICRCESVSAGELRNAVTEFGHRDLNRVKAFTRLGMGRCQGRVCQAAAAEIVAAAAGVSVETIGRLRGQAPIKPVAIGQFALEPAQ